MENKTKTFTLTTTDGRQHGALRDAYASLAEASDALRRVMGWDSIVLSASYTVSETQSACSAYQTQEECDEDQEGAYAPRIVVEYRAAK